MQIVDITLENAQQLLLDESAHRLVLVDFWAEWCGPCKSLMPILEKLANEYAGEFLLAKVNADEQNMIAAQFGVRSLPTVVLIKDGQPVDGFTGAQSEVFIRELLQKYLPKPWEKIVQQAQEFVAQDNFTEALPLLRDAYAQSQQAAEIAFLLTHALLALNRTEESEVILKNIKMVDRDATYDQLRAQLELRQQAAKTPAIAALETAYEQEPDNLNIAFELAVQLSQESYHKPALELLMTILRKDRNFAEGRARKTLTDILAALGKADPLSIEYQRKLFTLLY